MEENERNPASWAHSEAPCLTIHHGQGFSNIYSASLLLLHLDKDLKPWKAANIFSYRTTEVQDMMLDINRPGTNTGFVREDLQILFGTGQESARWDCCPATYEGRDCRPFFPNVIRPLTEPFRILRCFWRPITIHSLCRIESRKNMEEPVYVCWSYSLKLKSLHQCDVIYIIYIVVSEFPETYSSSSCL